MKIEEVLQIDFHILTSGKLNNGHSWPIQTDRKEARLSCNYCTAVSTKS